MYGRCCPGVATVCLAIGLCLPAFATEQSAASARQFTPAEHLMHVVIASYYGISHEQVMDLHARGYTYEDIATAANLAARSGRPLTDVVAKRDQSMEWTTIATSYSIAEADVNRPYRPAETRVAGARAEMSPGMAGGSSSYAMPISNIDWSRRYELTPLEMKRLRAKGLTDKEVYVVANAAALTGRPVDAFVDMIFRGATLEQIASEYNLNPDTLREVNPTWQSPEWGQAVKDGRWSFPAMDTHAKK
jgi:hypothetical protein